MFRTNLSFDMRSMEGGTPQPALYAAALDMIAFADEVGIENVIISEHHASEDGYIPVPALLAAAAGARTERIAVTLGAMILPLHDPVKVAEQIAVADLICGGRLHAVLAAGYSAQDFAAFGRSLGDRNRLMDEGLAIVTRALAGERFHHGDREVFVRPIPASRPPHLYVGGGVAAAAQRAARYSVGFWPMHDQLIPLYESACAEAGRSPGPVMRTAVGVHVANDVEAGWQEIAPHALHLARAYATISGDYAQSNSPLHGLDSLDAVRRSGVVQVLTPDQCVETAKDRPLALVPLIAGLDPKIGWTSLRLFASEALPRISLG